MDDPLDASADADNRLLQRSRDGDRHAFSELWRRHSTVAVAYARSLGASPPDPEDVVSEAFVSILRQLRVGAGPQRSFRPYLLTTVKNTWMTHVRRTPQTSPIDDAEHPPSSIGTIDADAMADSTILSEAFGSLPERWQHALWLSEVEQLPPREIAGILHIRPNSAAALTYRARDALRKAWIRAHLRDAEVGTDHARVLELLGAYAHDDLAPRSERFVAAHLDDCASCRAAAGEARHLARAMSLGPLLAGGAGLVIAPALFPADQAAAAVSGVSEVVDPSAWFAMQPTVEAAGHAAPVLWPMAAATAVALSVSGGLAMMPTTEPDASAATVPVVVQTSIPTPDPGTVGVPEAQSSSEPVAAPAPGVPEPSQAPVTEPTSSSSDEKSVKIVTKPGNGNGGANGRWSDVDRMLDPSGSNGNGNNGANGNNGNNGNGNNGANGNNGNGNNGNSGNGNGSGDQGDDDQGEDVAAFLSSARSYAESTVVVFAAAHDDTMSIAVWGADDTALAFSVDDQTVATLNDKTVWITQVPIDDADHTLTVHYLDETGQPGEVAAEAVISAS